MKSGSCARIAKISLTIFAMLFGAGNLMFPPKLGIEMGQYTWLGFFGFFLSAVVLPMIGLLAIVAFEGDYRKFFGRLSYPLGDIFIFMCMLIVGPLVVMPRIVMLSYEMLYSFLPTCVSPSIFAILFAMLAFIATYRPGKLLNIVGEFLSPLKVVTLLIIVIAGLLSGSAPEPVEGSAWELFGKAFNYGYLTLDVLGAIFFGAIIVHLLTTYASKEDRISTHEAMKLTAIASIFAGLLLGGVYLGMTLLGAYHGQGLGYLDQGSIFRELALRVLGTWGAVFMGVSVFLACFTTCVSLAAVVGEYVQNVSRKSLTYAQSVGIILAICVFIAQFGLKYIIEFSEPIILFFYPLLIVIMFCNLAYIVFGFKPITIPMLIAALMIVLYNFKLLAVPLFFLLQLGALV